MLKYTGRFVFGRKGRLTDGLELSLESFLEYEYQCLKDYILKALFLIDLQNFAFLN